MNRKLKIKVGLVRCRCGVWLASRFGEFLMRDSHVDLAAQMNLKSFLITDRLRASVWRALVSRAFLPGVSHSIETIRSRTIVDSSQGASSSLMVALEPPGDVARR